MEKVKEILQKIDYLVESNLSTEGKYRGDEFRDLLNELFQSFKELIEENAEDVKVLFKKIICMGKCTGAFGFYKLLYMSSLSFSKELLVYGIDHEPYYNNNDDVFEKYLLTASLGTDMEDFIKYAISKTGISKGHYSDYSNIFSISHNIHNKTQLYSSPKGMEEIIVRVIKETSFYHTRYKAIAVALCLGLKEAIPFIEKLFKDQELDVLQKINIHEMNGSNSFGRNINSVRDLSLALFYFKGEIKYKNLYDLLDGVETICKTDDELQIPFFAIVDFFKLNQ